MTIIIFIIMLGVIVFIHELGHFLVAKKSGVYIYEFSIGFGPKLFSFKRKNDPTSYMIRLIPFGGYVSMAGEEDIDENTDVPENERLCNKPWINRFLVMVAGVFNNFLLGFILLFIMGLIYGTISMTNVLDNIPETGAVYEAGIRDGDKIISVNGHKTNNYDDIQTYLALVEEGDSIELEIEDTNGKENEYTIKPKLDEDDNYYYGISIKKEESKGFISALIYAKDKFITIYKTMWIVIKSLFTGDLGIDSLSGPVGIYTIVDSVKSSMQMILYLTAYLSINIGFMNLLPIPAFDGGMVLFLIIEKIKGSKVNPKVQAYINAGGFILLMILMVVITIKDVINLF